MAFVLQHENTGGINRTPCTVAYKKALAPNRGEGFFVLQLTFVWLPPYFSVSSSYNRRALKIFLKFLFSVAP